MAQGAIEWIEIPARDLMVSPRFYEVVFGWKVNRDPGWEKYPMFMDGADKLGGGFTTHLKPMAEGGVLVYISVDDIEAMLSKITANGGRAVQPRTEISPEVGWWASFHDPAGNLMGLYQKRR